MLTKNTKSYNGQIYEIAYKRLKLKRREKVILQRLLGFLIRNDKPFPYPIDKLAERTGYSQSSIYESLNLLERARLIKRVGFTSRVKFIKGSILKRIYTLVQKRPRYIQVNNNTLVQKLEEIVSTSPVSGYKKTFLSLKHKEKDFFYLPVDKNIRITEFKNSEGPKHIKDMLSKLSKG